LKRKETERQTERQKDKYLVLVLSFLGELVTRKKKRLQHIKI
jgi:hypothetical protein